jgi:protein LSM14
MPPPPYGAPPGWFPPGQGFNQPPGPFPPHMGMGPPGFPGPHNVINQNQAPSGSRGPPSGPHASKDEIAPAQTKVVEADGMSKPAEQKAGAAKPPGATSTTAAASKQAPPPPVDSKPDVASALAPPHPQHAQQPPKPAAGGSGGRIIPAVPIPSPKVTKTTHRAQQPAAQTAQAAQPAAGATQQNATQLATAAVAAAMAKLNVQNASQPPTSDPLNNLAQKVEGMREQQSRTGRQPAAGGFRGRGGRGGRGAHQQHPKMEVPTTDFDFESSNAKFNKQDLVKEAIATGSPLGDASTAPTIEAVSIESSNEAETDDVIIPPSYNKGSSFFDNISSELKDREEASSKRGQEFRTEERRKNMETFGQGSVDGYRGGFRGRGRGRGRSRGLNTRGRSAPRGRGGAEFGEAA